MLVRSSSISTQSPEQIQVPKNADTGTDPESSYQDFVHYTKFSLVSRKEYFIIAFYKTENLEKFKANINNADILAPIFANLIKYYFPDLEKCVLITTPKRAHSEKLGYHFASEICERTSRLTGIEFLPDMMIATSKQKFNPNFIQVLPLPPGKRVILFDDIGTTYQTIYETIKTLRQNSDNHLENVHIPIFVGVNNN
ncbi:MAG: hypothetical protein WCI92_19145 [Bacteroidota bacterium]